MSDKIMRMFEDQRSNPFQFKYVQIHFNCKWSLLFVHVYRHITLCHSLSDLAKVPDPKVCLYVSL